MDCTQLPLGDICGSPACPTAFNYPCPASDPILTGTFIGFHDGRGQEWCVQVVIGVEPPPTSIANEVCPIDAPPEC
jgi:hypothetical protein